MKKIITLSILIACLSAEAQTVDKYFGNRIFNLNNRMHVVLNGTDTVYRQSKLIGTKFFGRVFMNPDSSETITSMGSDYVQVIDASTGKFKKITGANLEGFIEKTQTTTTTGGGGTQVIDIALPEDSSGEVEMFIIGVGGTTLGSIHDRRFIMFYNKTGVSPTINATAFTMNSAAVLRLSGMDASADIGYSVSGENLRITFTASTTEDVSWKVYYKIRSHTFPL